MRCNGDGRGILAVVSRAAPLTIRQGNNDPGLAADPVLFPRQKGHPAGRLAAAAAPLTTPRGENAGWDGLIPLLWWASHAGLQWSSGAVGALPALDNSVLITPAETKSPELRVSLHH